MEEAFGEGQEMVVFITELTMDPDASRFITEMDANDTSNTIKPC